MPLNHEPDLSHPLTGAFAPGSCKSNHINSVEMDTQIKWKLPKGRSVQLVKKSYRKTVRYSENEYHLMLSNAKLSGRKPAEWIRESSTSKTVKARFNQEDRKVLHVLAGAANNLNQITALSHKAGLNNVQQECLKVISEINGYLKILNQDGG